MFGLQNKTVIKNVFQFWLNKKSVIKLVCLKCVLIKTKIKYDFFGLSTSNQKITVLYLSSIALYYIYLHLYKNNIYMLNSDNKKNITEMNLEDNEVKDDV